MARVKTIISRSVFLNWYFLEGDDYSKIGKDAVNKWELDGKYSLSIQDLFNELGYIPMDKIINKGDMPFNILSNKYTEIKEPYKVLKVEWVD